MFVFVMAACIAGNTYYLSADDFKPGELNEVPIKVADQDLVLRFRYCPPGKISMKSPWARRKEPKQVDTKDDSAIKAAARRALAGLTDYTISPFYVLEYEVTARQFAILAGAAAYERVLAEIENLNENVPYYADAVAALKTKGDAPICNASFNDILEFCSVLEQASQSQNLLPTSLERQVFRPLTLSEWRYAGIAKSSQDSNQNAYFTNWNESGRFPDGYDPQTRLNQLIKIIEPGREYKGTQEDLVRILDDPRVVSDTSNIAAEALWMILAESIFLDVSPPSSLKSKREYPQRPVSPPNSWGLENIHNGLTEFVVNESSVSTMLDFWSHAMSRGFADDLDESYLAKPMIAFAGAGYSMPIKYGPAAPWQWKRFTVWGGPQWDDSADSIEPFKILEGDYSEKADQLYGFRICMQRLIRDDWFVAIRNPALQLEDVNRIAPVFDDHRETVRELVQTDKVSNYEGIVSYYEAIAYYKNNRREDAVSSFERLAGIAENSPANEISDESPKSKTDTQVVEENSLFYKTVLELASSEDSEVK